MFGDKAWIQARPWREIAVVGGGDEGSLDGAEGCWVKVLGKFALGGVMAENSVCLVRMGAPQWSLSGGVGLKSSVTQAIGAVTQAGDYDLVMFKKITSNFVKMAMRLSSQSCPIEMRKPVVV